MRILIFFLFVPLISHSQTSSSFKKEPFKDTTGNYYVLTDSVKIENGKDENRIVFFKAMVPAKIWDGYIARSNKKDNELFSWIASMLSIEAKHTLKNTLSFEPFNSQFLMFYEKDQTFICRYNMMGRNGYGNLVETTQLVKYDVENVLK